MGSSQHGDFQKQPHQGSPSFSSLLLIPIPSHNTLLTVLQRSIPLNRDILCPFLPGNLVQVFSPFSTLVSSFSKRNNCPRSSWSSRFMKNQQCPTGSRHSLAPEALEQTTFCQALSNRDGGSVGYEQESMPQDTRPSLPRAPDKLHRQMACAEDSHLLVQIQYLILVNMHFTLIGHISTGSQFTEQGPPLASRQVWEVAEGLNSLQSPPTITWSCRVDGARLAGSPWPALWEQGLRDIHSFDSYTGLWEDWEVA